MADLTIGGETFNVEVTGDPTHPALVLSHALGADMTMWDAQMPALAKQFRVVRYDTRGHGGSARGATPVSIARLGADVLAILDALEIETAHFLGLSMGGAVGLWLLANAPDRIGRAVLANTAPRLGSPEGWNARITTALAGGMGELATATIERWFSAPFAARAPQAVERVHAGLRTVSPEGYAACCAALRDMDLRGVLHGIPHDVLIVIGQDDPTVPAADSAAFIAGLAGARHVTLDARHISNIEAEGAFNAAVIAFLTAKAATRTRTKRPAEAASAASPAPARAKRSGAARRSSAARSPLQKTTTKRAPAKKAPSKKKVAETRRRPVRKGTARRSATTKASPPKKMPKAVVDKPTVPKARKAAARKAATTRRATSATAVRGAVKKAKPRKVAPKKVSKPAGKGVTKKMPVARRKPATKPRRPTGRGKR